MERSGGSVPRVAICMAIAAICVTTVCGSTEDGFLRDIEHRLQKLKHARTLDALPFSFNPGQCGVGALVVVHGGAQPDIQSVRSHAPPMAKFATEDVEFIHVSEAACLATVTSIPGDLLIYDDGSLGDIDFLNRLTSVGGHLVIWGEPGAISQRIESLAGLQNLQAVQGSLNIVNMHGIESLFGLGRLIDLGGDLLLWDNSKLQNFQGIGPLAKVTKTLYIDNNKAMTDLSGLETLEEVGFDFLLKGNQQLTDLSALGNLNTVWNSIMIQNMQALESLSFLSSLERLGNGIDIYETPLLRDLTGLERLTEIPGDLTLTANNLESLAGLENVQTIGLDLIISQDTGLTSLLGLQNVQSVGGLISVSDNPLLQSCEGLDGIKETGEDLIVQRNSALTTLDGLFITVVGTKLGGNIVVQDNPQLVSLGALPQTLTQVRGGVRIAGNSPALARPEIDAIQRTAVQMA